MKNLTRFPSVLVLAALPALWMAADPAAPRERPLMGEQESDPQFVHPQSPILPSPRSAPSPRVTNGSVFESGVLKLPDGATLVLPANAIVEEHGGSSVEFYLTKTTRCAGQPPVTLHFEAARKHFGIAQRTADGATVVSTFGEWSNPGGTASIELLVLVPKGTPHRTDSGLHGSSSQASSRFDPGDDDLKDCYWYAGSRPADGWHEIETGLHYNRFLAPR